MDAFVIHGGRPLRGRARVPGSKNATLPLMAAALLTDEPVTLRDVPDLADVRNMMKLLRALGCIADRNEQRAVHLHVTDTNQSLAHYDIVRTMRAGICVLGPLLARRGEGRVSMPGGCAIGDRPVDLHLRGLRALGAEIELDAGYITATVPGKRLRGAHVFLGGPNGSTVLGTANVLSAAALAEGTTVIECAACEPEIEALAQMLNGMGACIRGAGSPRITIQGVDRLAGIEHTVIPDRIWAGTYALAAAITNGEVYLDNFPTDALTALIDRLHEVGVRVVPVGEGQGTMPSGGADGNGSMPCGSAAAPPSHAVPITTPAAAAFTKDRARAVAATEAALPCAATETVRIESPRLLQPVQVVTQPHPGFPTDLQAQMMALLCLADGNSIVTEKIFPDRFLHVAEMARMGANLVRSGPTVLVAGVRELIGAPVMASDLRASAGLVLAGLAARGETTINRVYHLDRGYEKMEQSLQQLGAAIERVNREAV